MITDSSNNNGNSENSNENNGNSDNEQSNVTTTEASSNGRKKRSYVAMTCLEVKSIMEDINDLVDLGLENGIYR